MERDDEIKAAYAIGERVRSLRKARRLSQLQVAKRARMDVSGINRIEQARGEHVPLTWTLVRIANALSVQPSEIFSVLDSVPEADAI